MSAMRRPRHCLVRQDSSISAMLSQLPCFGGVVDLQSAGQGEGLLGRERLVERGDAVGVEVVHHQDDLVRVGVVDGQQVVDAVGPVDAGPGRFGVGAAPSAQWLGPDEDRAGPVADVLGVLTGGLPRPGRRARPGVCEQLQWLLVHHDHRIGRIVRPGVDSQDVFHRRDERGAAVRRDRPACFQVRLERPLFRTRPIVEWSIGGIPSVRSTCFSSRRSVQR